MVQNVQARQETAVTVEVTVPDLMDLAKEDGIRRKVAWAMRKTPYGQREGPAVMRMEVDYAVWWAAERFPGRSEGRLKGWLKYATTAAYNHLKNLNKALGYGAANVSLDALLEEVGKEDAIFAGRDTVKDDLEWKEVEEKMLSTADTWEKKGTKSGKAARLLMLGKTPEEVAQEADITSRQARRVREKLLAQAV
jgi:hypothetical protein